MNPHDTPFSSQSLPKPPPPKQKWAVDQTAFDSLLAWLAQDRDQAGLKYEEIRLILIKYFTGRGCTLAEDLTDEVMNRVAKKLPEISESYVGEPKLYFYGVARIVLLEYRNRKSSEVELPFNLQSPETPEDSEQEYQCLEQCMQHLSAPNRELVLSYYQEEKTAKINHRKELAQSLGIALNALRIRACRIRAGLEECLRLCLEDGRAG